MPPFESDTHASNANLNGSTAQPFKANSLLLHDETQATSGATVKEFYEHGSSISNISLTIKDEAQVALSASDSYANLVTRDVYVGAGLTPTDFKSVLDTLDAKADVTIDAVTGVNTIQTNELRVMNMGSALLTPPSLGVNIEEFINSGLTNATIVFKDEYQVGLSSSDNYANLVTRDLYVGGGLTPSDYKSVLTTLNALTASGTVAQVVPFQTREMKRRVSDNVSIGYPFSGFSSVPAGTDVWIDLISPASLTITPKTAGNKIIISYLLTFNIQGEVGDYGFVVKRLASGIETMLPNATDSNDSTFAVISSPLVTSGTTHGHTTEVRIVDESCLDVATQYKLYIRCTDADSTSQATFYLNGPGGGEEPHEPTTLLATYEGTLSSVVFTEIRA